MWGIVSLLKYLILEPSFFCIKKKSTDRTDCDTEGLFHLHRTEHTSKEIFNFSVLTPREHSL